MNPYWVSFWAKSSDLPAFEYHGPWWISGMRGGYDEGTDEEESICAAVMAEDEDAAKRTLEAAFDPGHRLTEWRFTRLRNDTWDPLANVSGRFEPKSWMRWPWPTPTEPGSEAGR